MTTGVLGSIELYPVSSRMYSALIDSLRAIVWEADPKTFQFRFVSSHAEALLGFPREEWLQDPEFWKHHTHPDDVEGAAAYCFDCIAKGKNHAFEYRMIARDGRVVWLRDIVTVDCSNAGETRLYGVMIDITDRRQMEEDRKQLERELYQAQKMDALGRLAGSIAHDFNNLLAVITSYTEALTNGASASGDRVADLREIRRAAQRGAQLTGQLLAFSRKDAVEPQRVSLDSEIAEVAAMLHRLLGARVQLRVDLGCADAVIRSGPGHIQQVVMNLALNARDAMPTGGVLSITTHAEGQELVLRVSDTGEGMPDSVKAHLFEPFFTTKPPGKGTGLGLSTVFGIVHQAKGRITVQSRQGEGTVFEIRLPRSAPRSA